MNETTKKMLAELDAAIMECFGFQTNTCRKNSTTTVKAVRTLKRLNRQDRGKRC